MPIDMSIDKTVIDYMKRKAVKERIKMLLGKDIRLYVEDYNYGYRVIIYDELTWNDMIALAEAHIPAYRSCGSYIIYVQ